MCGALRPKTKGGEMKADKSSAQKRASPSPMNLPAALPPLVSQKSITPKSFLEDAYQSWIEVRKDGKQSGPTLEKVSISDGVICLRSHLLRCHSSSHSSTDHYISFELHAQMGGFLVVMDDSSHIPMLRDLGNKVNDLILKEAEIDLGMALDIFVRELDRSSEMLLGSFDEQDKEWNEEWDEAKDEDWGEVEIEENDYYNPEQQPHSDQKNSQNSSTSSALSWAKYESKWDMKEAAIRALRREKTLVEKQESRSRDRSSSLGFTSKAVSLMLKKALFHFILKYKSQEDIRMEVEAVDHNIFHWRIRFRAFGHSSRLQHDLVILDSKYDRDYVEVEMKFDMNLWPFYPPQVNLKYPLLEGFFVAAIVCMDELLLEKWNPVTRVPDILEKIWKLLASHARVDPMNEVNNPKNFGKAAYGRAEQMLCRLSQVTSMPPRTYTALGLKSLNISDQQEPVELQRQLSGEENRDIKNQKKHKFKPKQKKPTSTNIEVKTNANAKLL